ncbi:MAG: NADH-quinone oxidoreductase subunit NuoG [Bryobacteraceae bacterium]|nr:NADH-quinone oxidoreductase subunit NuoG [Bryobacteraceae bacterium]
MANMVTITINGRQITVPAGTLVIEAAKQAGIDIPAFCYYEGFSVQAACRMCLVEVEKMPKLQPSCALPAAEGMVIHTESPKVVEARKSMLEFLLTNHPLDCPVCDKGGECELQDMTFRYGLGESRFLEIKHHADEKQWSPLVFYDPARCILCYRCIRVCDEGLGVGALGLSYRGVSAEIIPNRGDHLECDECGWCIDVCPVGALTSGTYRYRSRPWEMNYVPAVCTHCSNGCKTTLSVRNGEIIRANNRDRSGINGEFLCVKGRFAFDFVHSGERLQTPLIRKDGRLEPASWSEALKAAAARVRASIERNGKAAVIGSTRTTNEENYYLQKFARQVLRTNNIDHHRSGDVITLLQALGGREGALATVQDLYTCDAALVVGADLSQQHPLLAVQLRANWRHHQSPVFVISAGPVREDQYAARSIRAEAGTEADRLEELRADLQARRNLVILYGPSMKGEAVRRLVAFGDSLGIPVKYVCLVDYANSRGALDMGLLPHLAPGYRPVEIPGMTLDAMLEAPDLDLVWVVGANPLEGGRRFVSRDAFMIVNELFLTETAQQADIVFPAMSLYEKNGTVTNVCGEVQRTKAGPKVMGTKSDLEILGLIAAQLGFDLGVPLPDRVFEEIRREVPGYNVPLALIATGGAAPTKPPAVPAEVDAQPELVRSSGDTLFTSGTLGKYSKKLGEVIEAPGRLYQVLVP